MRGSVLFGVVIFSVQGAKVCSGCLCTQFYVVFPLKRLGEMQSDSLQLLPSGWPPPAPPFTLAGLLKQ